MMVTVAGTATPANGLLEELFMESKSPAEPFQKSVGEGLCYVRFTPESGHSSDRLACPLCAISRHRAALDHLVGASLGAPTVIQFSDLMPAMKC